ncbi:CCHC-type domain-containing protein [Trichonephila clavipes]|nr:CCHC-type domain-containing protein [Trichonephila clavipes]
MSSRHHIDDFMCGRIIGKIEEGRLYLQVDDHVHPGNCPAAVSSKKKQDLLHMEFYHHLPRWAMNEQMSYFSSFSDEWSRDLKTTKEIPVVFMYRNSVHVEEEEAKELLEVITAERLETEQQQKLEQQEQLSIEKLRLEIELSRNTNQSATQNNGQTSRVKSLDEIVKMVRLLTVKRAKWNDSEKRSFNGSGGKQPFGKKKSDNFSSRKNFDKGQVTEIKKFACFPCGSDKHLKRDCPKNKEVDNKRLNVNKVSTEETELVDGTVAARVDLLGKVIPRRAIEDKLSKLGKTSISVDGKLVHALVDSGTEITVIKKDLVPGISVEGASTIYLKGIFGPAVKCPLVYVPIGLTTGGQVNVVHQQVLCALAEVLVEDVLLPPDVLDMLGGAQSEENPLAQSSQDLRVDSGNVDETEVSSGILPEKAQEHIEDFQRNITSCRNEVGTLGTKDEEVTAEMDKGIMVADSFCSEREYCAELALVYGRCIS